VDARAYRRYVCDKCGKGSMVATGHVLPPAAPNAQPKFLHKCDECGATADLEKQYPHIDFVPVGDVAASA
jgi:hypothetical protein